MHMIGQCSFRHLILYNAIGTIIIVLVCMNRYYNQLFCILPIWEVVFFSYPIFSFSFFYIQGFHSKWNRFVGTKHPSLWIFIRKLKDEERSERRRIRTVHEGRDGPKMRRKWRKLEKRIKRLKREYRRGIRNAGQYWGAMTYVVKSFD